ncbi:flagellar protein FlaG [Noviherbaspirillum aridicola]|uniref:Flagellar protein n=1 Tax=Noviherbaspirillum aridicola TaxID=2849687 RepID=A0ABQ4Q651_9BURK|nr:flagellar protein FlaG [Noviherbaspirillum aridicola]GIZ52696.1 flagellar protein [Noviherbaspirillum aridicola]
MDIRPVGTGNAAGAAPAPILPGTAPAQKPAADPTIAGALVQQPGGVPDAEQVKKAVQDINSAMKAMSNKIEFSVDAESKEPIVRVRDAETGDVIRQIPTEEALEISKALDRVQGLLLRQTA